MDFSVVVPCYNSESYISETLESILSQDHRPNEIIVVNDGSTDGTADILRTFLPYIRVIDIDNGGAPRARHIGVKKSTSSFIAFCDHDDIWETNHISRLNILLTGFGVPFVFSNFVRMRGEILDKKSHMECDDTGYWKNPGQRVGDNLYIATEPLLPRILRYQTIFPSCMGILKEYYLNVGGYDPQFGRNVSEDLEFSLRCTKQGPAGIDLEPTVRIRRHGGNYSWDWVRGLNDSIEILYFSIENHDLHPEYMDIVNDEIRRRSLQGIYCGYLQCRFEEIQCFGKNLRRCDLGWKEKIKLFIASLPLPIAHRLCRLLITSAEVKIVGDSKKSI